MISAQGLAALRVAATLTHELPHLRTHIRDGRRPVLTIRNEPPRTGGTEAGLVLSPCGFRTRVAQAWLATRHGARLQFLDLAGDPGIDVGVPTDGEAFPGGIYRVPIGPRWLYGFAVCAQPGWCEGVARSVLDEHGAVGPCSVALRSDATLDTTLCFAETPDHRRFAEDRIVDLLEMLLARLTAEAICNQAVVGSLRS